VLDSTILGWKESRSKMPERDKSSTSEFEKFC
jgi:hypothetical protein